MPTVASSPAIRRSLLLLGVVLLLVAGVAVIRHATRDVVYVRTARAAEGDILSSVSTNGKVEPTQLFQAHAAQPGQVQQVYVHAGQLVAANTLLLRMDTTDAQAKIASAKEAITSAVAAQTDVQQGGSQEERIALSGDLARARLQVDQARQGLASLQQLQARGAASANEVAAARERLLTAQSSLTSLQQRQTQRYAPTDRARVAAQVTEGRTSLQAAQVQLENSVIRAPFAGTVFSLPVRQFDYVAAGEELAQVADLTHMQVLAYFDEPEIGKLKQNSAVIVTWDARPGKEWHGHIVRVPTTVINYGTRNVGECLINIDDATGDLLPNTNVTARVTTQQVYRVLTIPREALRTETEAPRNFVYVVRNGKLHKTGVQVGALNLQTVQITGGLSAGDVLALNTTSNVDLADGLAVQEAK
ncbi:efflux RND transporter periplasmic adaptor subunit [Terriglobus aquaticus]|uniref:Efflux RND transporter periplasmic adaptor subunit n=1 Tax=Terriglobus aquaticus TaxID=940139 RepID=A0ABW9KK17_9BACT|nr:efflux RND transporter periplasmic adaptor subunit [Terriglobus aquaticus]